MSIRFGAPATTANLGAGFDVAGAALDLWNELELDEGDGADESQLGVQAFAIYASPSKWSFRWTSRIPRERGLGSSAAVVALGLVAGAHAAGVDPTAEELLAAGLELEGHADNLAPALAGGVCLTWDGRIARLADELPAVPVAVVPATRVRTAASRAALPAVIDRSDAVFSIARAALLGSAIASGDKDLFAASSDDRLHEPYRAAAAPHLLELRRNLPDGALGVTLSGSGPSVIVWADPAHVASVVDQVRALCPAHEVFELAISPKGAGRLT